jgi:hypothetical protein
MDKTILMKFYVGEFAKKKNCQTIFKYEDINTSLNLSEYGCIQHLLSYHGYMRMGNIL